MLNGEHQMTSGHLSTSAPLVLSAASSVVGRLEQCQAFYSRLGDLERAFRPLVRLPRPAGEEAAVAFLSSVSQACQLYLDRCSLPERQVFRLTSDLQAAAALAASTPTNRRT